MVIWAKAVGEMTLVTRTAVSSQWFFLSLLKLDKLQQRIHRKLSEAIVADYHCNFWNAAFMLTLSHTAERRMWAHHGRRPKKQSNAGADSQPLAQRDYPLKHGTRLHITNSMRNTTYMRHVFVTRLRCRSVADNAFACWTFPPAISSVGRLLTFVVWPLAYVRLNTPIFCTHFVFRFLLFDCFDRWPLAVDRGWDLMRTCNWCITDIDHFHCPPMPSSMNDLALFTDLSSLWQIYGIFCSEA